MIRTLIVDDDSLIHVTLRSLIDWESCGYVVVQDCAGGNQALSYLMERPVDLLITDIKMPGMDGLELMRQLRQSRSMPVTVVLSGYDEFELVREAFRLGAYDYLLKGNISRTSLTRLLSGLREKVFPSAAGPAAAGAAQQGPAELEEAAACCETLCKLSVLQGPGSVCAQGQYGELVRAYDTQAPGCDRLIAALCGEDGELLDQESGRWFSGLKRLDNKEHIQRCLVLLARLGERLESYGLSFSRVFPERPDFHTLLREFASKGEREIWLRNTLRRVREACDSQRQERQKSAIQRAKEFMQDNFTNPELMLKTVADYVGFNEKYFSTRFTRECSCTFINYLNDLRLKRAQELLIQTDMKIYEISDAVGYSSVEHFNHMFKKKLCISPKDFRKSKI